MKSKVISFVLGVAVAAAFYEMTGIRLRGDRAGHEAPNGSAPMAVPGDSSPASARFAPTSAPALPPRPVHSDQTANVQADLAEAKARANFAERQLEAIEGHPVPWPDNVAPAFKRESVEQQLKEYVVDRGLGKVKSMNCSEYPCVGVVQLTDSGPEGAKALQAALGEMVKQHYSGKVMLGIQNTKVKNGSNVASYAGVGIAPDDIDVRTRARYRAKLELEEYSQ